MSAMPRMATTTPTTATITSGDSLEDMAFMGTVSCVVGIASAKDISANWKRMIARMKKVILNAFFDRAGTDRDSDNL